MVEEVRVAVEVDDGLVVGEALSLGWHDDALGGEGARRAGACHVADVFGAAGAGVGDVVGAAALVDPGGLLEAGAAGQGDLGRALAVGDHVLVQLDVVQVRVAVVEVCLAVGVDEDGGVDLGACDQWLAEGVLVRTEDVGACCNTDAV